MDELNQLMKTLNVNNSQENWIYRGVSDSDFKLVPTLGRKLKDGTKFSSLCLAINHITEMITQDYKQSKNISTNYTGLSQHYGLPTLALDWTYCDDVALYFAFTTYIIDFFKEKFENNKNLKMEVLREEFNQHEYAIYMLDQKFIDKEGSKYNLILKIAETDLYNDRMKNQQGLLSELDYKNNSSIDVTKSQIEIMKEWAIKNDKKISIYECDKSEPNNKIVTHVKTLQINGQIFAKKIYFKLRQQDREKLMKRLSENDIITNKLFPDFEGIKRHLQISYAYNMLRDFKIATDLYDSREDDFSNTEIIDFRK